MSVKVIAQLNAFSTEKTEYEFEPQSVSAIIKKIDTNNVSNTGWRVLFNDEIVTDFSRVPADGTTVLLKLVPTGDNKETGNGMKIGGGALAALGVIVGLTIGWTGFGGVLAGSLIGSGVGLLLGGVALYNMDIPSLKDRPSPDQDPSIRGSQNQLRQRGYIPVLLGKRRFYTDLAMTSYTWVDPETGSMYLYQLFCAGQKDIVIDESTLKIDETLLSSYQSGDNIEYAISYGGSVPPVFTKCVHEDQIMGILRHSTEDGTDASIIKTTPECTELNVDIFFLSGLGKYNDEGKLKETSVTVKAYYKKADEPDAAYQLLGNFTETGNVITGEELKTKRYAITKTGLVSSMYTVKITRETGDSTDNKVIDDVYVGSIRAIKDELPVSARRCRQLTLVALKIKATEKLNNVVQKLNFIAQSKMPVWDGIHSGSSGWTQSELTSNPASAAVYAMQTEIAQQRLASSEIDWTSFERLYTWCNVHGYECNTYITDSMSISQLLSAIGSTCRTEILRMNGKITALMDIERSSAVQLFTPRNSYNYSETIISADIPDALNIGFEDKDSGYAANEFYLYNTPSGNKAEEPHTIQDVQLWGVTSSEQARKLGMWKYAVTRNRPFFHTWSCDVEYLMCQKGDWVKYAGDIALIGTTQCRVAESLYHDGQCIGIIVDELVHMSEGINVIRYRQSDGTLHLQEIIYSAEDTKTLLFVSILPGEEAPSPDDLVTVGLQNFDTIDLIIADIKCDGNLSAEITAVDYSPAVFDVDNPDFVLPDFDSKISSVPATVDNGIISPSEWNIFFTYHDGLEEPDTPKGDGTTNGWHTTPSSESIWVSSKYAKNIFSGQWSKPRTNIGPKGEDGTDGKDGKDGISLTNKGNWTASTSYDVNDYVYYASNKTSYVCKEKHTSGSTFDPSKWTVLSAQGQPGSSATQYYIHYVYADDTTGTNYSTNQTRKYIGTYTDTTQADAASFAALPAGVVWSQITGTDGKDGEDGKDGHTPTVSVSKSGTTTTINIDGKTSTINDGTNGENGLTPNPNIQSGNRDGDGWSGFDYFWNGNFQKNNSTTNENYIYSAPTEKFVSAGKTYTISFEAKQNGNLKDGATEVFYYGNDYSNTGYITSKTYRPTTEWQKFTHTFTITAGKVLVNQRIRFDNNGTKTTGQTANLVIRNVKIEEGSVATPFCYSNRDNSEEGEYYTYNNIDKISAGTFKKTGGSNGTWDSQIYSNKGYSKCSVSAKASQTNAWIMFGLNSDPKTDANYTSIDFAWYFVGNGTLQIYENGNQVNVGSLTYTTSTVLRIDYDGTNVKYYKDNVLIRSYTRTSNTLLYLDTSFYSLNGILNSLSFSPIGSTGNTGAKGDSYSASLTMGKMSTGVWSLNVYKNGVLCTDDLYLNIKIFNSNTNAWTTSAYSGTKITTGTYSNNYGTEGLTAYNVKVCSDSGLTKVLCEAETHVGEKGETGSPGAPGSPGSPGTPGTSAIATTISTNTIYVKCDSNGNVMNAQSYTINVNSRQGTSRVAQTITKPSNPTGVTITATNPTANADGSIVFAFTNGSNLGNVSKNALTFTVGTATFVINIIKDGIAHGLGMKVNYSAFSTPNDAEIYFHGYDENGQPADVNGWVMFKGEKVEIAKGMHVNPDTLIPWSADVFMVKRSTTIFNVWYDSTNTTWKYLASGGSSTANWSWQDTDIIFARYKNSSASEGAIPSGVIYNPALTKSEIFIQAFQIEANSIKAEKIDATGLEVNQLKSKNFNGSAGSESGFYFNGTDSAVIVGGISVPANTELHYGNAIYDSEYIKNSDYSSVVAFGKNAGYKTNVKGNYSASVTYERRDVVISSGKYYASLVDNNRNHAITDTAYWMDMTDGLNAESVAIGWDSLCSNVSGKYNVAVGPKTLTVNSEGGENTAIGQVALYKNTTGNRNVAVGSNALVHNTSGTGNIGIGTGAGLNITSGSDNIAIGNSVNVFRDYLSNQINIGNKIQYMEFYAYMTQDEVFNALATMCNGAVANKYVSAMGRVGDPESGKNKTFDHLRFDSTSKLVLRNCNETVYLTVNKGSNTGIGSRLQVMVLSWN